MKIRFCFRGLAAFFTLALLTASAEVQIIPQVADGGGWLTTVVLAHKTATTQPVSLSFNRKTGSGGTTPWTPLFQESVSLGSISLAAGSTLFLHTTGAAATLTEGWGQIDAAAGVVGYAIFTSRTPGLPDQDATAPAVPASNRVLVPFDNTSGFVTAVAVANTTNEPETVEATLRTTNGSTTGALATLPAKGQTTFLMENQFPVTAGTSGLAEFYVTSGSISVIALRANPSQAFTAAPVYFQTGTPIIGAPNAAQTSSPQTQVIPQVADGGGWSTTIVLTNTTTGQLPVTLNFKQAIPNGAGATMPWIPAFQDSSALTFNVPAGSSRFLRTPGTAATLSQGWAELVADPRVTGYAIFTSRATPGGRAQDSTAPAVSASSRILVPFDNSTGLVTAIALVNPNASVETVSVNFRTSNGVSSAATAISLPAQGQTTFLMPARFPETAAKSGMGEFYVSSGTISIIALRGNSGGAITSAPVFFETGTPIITTGGGGGGSSPGNTNPTQAEIDTWISRGSYTSGAINLTRSTSYINADFGSTTTTVAKQDFFGAQFDRIGGADLAKSLRGELPPAFPNLTPAPGSCVVYDLALQTNPYPSLTSAGLDAGSQILSSGPNGVQSALRQTNQAGGFSYNATALPNTYLAAGQYTLSGPGGASVGAFSGALDVVPDLIVTNNPADFNLINRSAGLTVRWTGGDSSTVLTIKGTSLIATQTGSIGGTSFICIQNTSAGQFTVPANILSQLPASPANAGGGLMHGSFTVSANGKGARLTAPSGLDILTAFNGWNWIFTPQYQ